jgi:SAM-dependent methyltransferase
MFTDAAFDPVAAAYDDDFTRTPIARLMRQAVWARMDTHFQAGMRVLELGCGTGEDAVHLAQRGIHVTATDASENMLAATQRKAKSMGVWGLVETQQLDMNALSTEESRKKKESGDGASSFFFPLSSFDGVLSNFGAFNCVTHLQSLIFNLSQWTKPHARLTFVVMGPFCPWEIVWHLAHGQVRQAFRRFARDGALARVGCNTVRVFYPSPRTLIKLCEPYFKPLRVSGLGVFVPPPYVQSSQYSVTSSQLDAFNLATDSRTALWLLNTANWLERRVANWFPFTQCGDHYILELERR